MVLYMPLCIHPVHDWVGECSPPLYIYVANAVFSVGADAWAGHVLHLHRPCILAIYVSMVNVTTGPKCPVAVAIY